MVTTDTLGARPNRPMAVAPGAPAEADLPGMAHKSGVSWGAVLAGAAAAAALSLVLLILGVGLGLSSVSPWAQAGMGADTFGVSTVLWLAFTQLAAAGVGGYLAGRLRAQWLDTPRDEVYFRDTAHGFLAWAIATLFTAAVLTSSIGAIVGGGAGVAAEVAGDASAMASASASPQQDLGADGAGLLDYHVDRLFRRDATAANTSWDDDGAVRAQAGQAGETAESTRILRHGLAAGTLSENDSSYLAQRVAQRTGLSAQRAQDRVTRVFADAQEAVQSATDRVRQAADAARKASAYAALWMFIALLMGAFVASLVATWGGRQRDAWPSSPIH